jgi:hypothetical protein
MDNQMDAIGSNHAVKFSNFRTPDLHVQNHYFCALKKNL